jgi:hypothetical protein
MTKISPDVEMPDEYAGRPAGEDHRPHRLVGGQGVDHPVQLVDLGHVHVAARRVGEGDDGDGALELDADQAGHVTLAMGWSYFGRYARSTSSMIRSSWLSVLHGFTTWQKRR